MYIGEKAAIVSGRIGRHSRGATSRDANRELTASDGLVLLEGDIGKPPARRLRRQSTPSEQRHALLLLQSCKRVKTFRDAS